MTDKPQRVAVLGAGTMGSQIAAHLANARIPSILLDLPSQEGDRSAIARQAWKFLAKRKPPALFTLERARLIEVGNFEDDMDQVGSCDWVIEAIAEKLEWKRSLFEKVAAHRQPGTVVSTNTSGLPLSSLAEGFDEDFRRHFLGTHFFNPPRYMKLLEVIPGEETLPEVLAWIERIGGSLLGKGIVIAKDRPNFIGNRIGTFAGCRAMALREELGLTIEEVDFLTGPAIGRPKTGTYRLGDLVGNDVMAYVQHNLYENLPEDPWRESFLPDRLLSELVKRGWAGRKAGRGFYRKVGSEILVLDPETFEYRSQTKPEFPSVAAVKEEPNPARRVAAILEAGGRAADFLWPLLRDTFAYAAGRVPEITDEFYQIDRAMRWGFAWDLGPFQLWDGLGVERVVERARGDGVEFPDWISALLETSRQSFYVEKDTVRYFDAGRRSYQDLPSDPEKLSIKLLKRQKPAILSNPSASLIDLGDGVACLEFHSKMNSLDPQIVAMSQEALAEVERNFVGMVVGNQGRDFSVGANLFFLLQAATAGQWDQIDQSVRAFQNMTTSFRAASKPVVAAPFQRTLAGGCEVCLGCDAIVAAAETYLGLVEVGVGLIPAGGGTMELLARNVEEFSSDPGADRIPGVKRAFQAIGMAKVSSSADEALEMRILRASDRIEMDGDRVLFRAKKRVLGLAETGYQAPPPRTDIPVEGASGLAVLQVGLHLMKSAGYISEYDAVLGRKLSYVLCGGDLNHSTTVGEDYLLDLEREAFVSLCGEEKTRQRIEAMLKTGKPLRN